MKGICHKCFATNVELDTDYLDKHGTVRCKDCAEEYA